jgi:hypothetical protein
MTKTCRGADVGEGIGVGVVLDLEAVPVPGALDDVAGAHAAVKSIAATGTISKRWIEAIPKIMAAIAESTLSDR